MTDINPDDKEVVIGGVHVNLTPSAQTTSSGRVKVIQVGPMAGGVAISVCVPVCAPAVPATIPREPVVFGDVVAMAATKKEVGPRVPGTCAATEIFIIQHTEVRSTVSPGGETGGASKAMAAVSPGGTRVVLPSADAILGFSEEYRLLNGLVLNAVTSTYILPTMAADGRGKVPGGATVAVAAEVP